MKVALVFVPLVEANLQVNVAPAADGSAGACTETCAFCALLTRPAAGVATAPPVHETEKAWPFFTQSESVTATGAGAVPAAAVTAALAGETENALDKASSAAPSAATPPQAVQSRRAIAMRGMGGSSRRRACCARPRSPCIGQGDEPPKGR